MYRRSREAEVDALRASAERLSKQDDPESQVAGRLVLVEPFTPVRNKAGNLLLSTLWSVWHQSCIGRQITERTVQRQVVFNPHVGELSVWGYFTDWTTQSPSGMFTAILGAPTESSGSHRLITPPNMDRDELVVATTMLSDIELGLITTTPVSAERAQSLLEEYSGKNPFTVMWLCQNLEQLPQE